MDIDELPCGCFTTIVGAAWWTCCCKEHGNKDFVTPMPEDVAEFLKSYLNIEEVEG